MRTTLGATAFAVAANALERLFATSGGCMRGVTTAAGAAPGAGAGAATCCAFPAFAVGVTAFPSQDPSKLAKPIMPMIACPRSLMILLLLGCPAE